MNPQVHDNALVIDASAAIALLVHEPAAAEVDSVLIKAGASGARLIVPGFFWLEIVNVLARRYGHDSARLMERLAELDELDLETVEQSRPELLLVIDLVDRFRLTAYDAAYLALAEAAEARLLTADRALGRVAGARAILVGVPGEIAEEPVEYGPPEWVTWPGASAYLEGVRRRVYRWAEESGSGE